MLVAQPSLTLGNPMDCSPPDSMEFSRQEYWSGLPFPSPRDLPDPGIELRSPALQAFFTVREAHGRTGALSDVKSAVFHPLASVLMQLKTKTLFLVDVIPPTPQADRCVFPTRFLREIKSTHTVQCVRSGGRHWCHYTSACLEPGPASPAAQTGTCEHRETGVIHTEVGVKQKGYRVFATKSGSTWQLAFTVRTW